MNKWVRIIVLVVAVCVFCFSGYKIWETLSGYSKAGSAYDNVADMFVTSVDGSGTAEDEPYGDITSSFIDSATPDAPVSDTGSSENTNDELAGMIGSMESVDWTRWAEQPPITVDFDAMLAQWPDVVGWLYCEGTKINYPVLQGDDNDEYLHHLPDGTYNFSGSLFMEWTNSPDFGDLNTFIYGHSMKNGTMFGSLEQYKNQSYYDEHPVIWLLTPGGNFRLDLIAGFYTLADSDAYDMHLQIDSLRGYVQECIDDSTFDSGIAAEDVSRVVVLSTCSHAFDNARYIVICKLTPCWAGAA